MATKVARRAYKLRAKEKNGGTLTPRERAWLDGYVPGKGGRPRLKVVRDEHAPPDAAAEVADPVDASDPAVAPEFTAAADVETPAPDPVTVKPRFDKSSAGKKGSGDWRAKYRMGGADGDREATCVQLASFWCEGLIRLNESIVRNGGTPAIASDMLIGKSDRGELMVGPLGRCFVIAVDQLMPSDFVIGPEIQACAISSGVIGQAWWQSRKAKVKESASARAARTWVNANPAPAPAPAPEPAAPGDEPRVTLVHPPSTSKKPIDDDTVF